MDKIKIHHLNCVDILTPMQLSAIGHCLLLETANRLILIDTGIGLNDVRDPLKRIGKEVIKIAGYRFNESSTAIRQIEKLGLNPALVTDCIISHLDNDHIGGLADFPNATVHISMEEYNNFKSGNPRYLQAPMLHNPKIITYGPSFNQWNGLESRHLNLQIADISLIPLFGHTHGHCGVAINLHDTSLFYIGDAYYLRTELEDDSQPVSQLAKNRADDDIQRINTLNILRNFINQHPEIIVFGYHDIKELDQFICN